MTTPYTVTTPEYVAWAKRGEAVGLNKSKFNKLVNELANIINTGEYDARDYNNARERIKNVFDFDHCDCE